MQYLCICQRLDSSKLFEGHWLTSPGGAHGLSCCSGWWQWGSPSGEWSPKVGVSKVLRTPLKVRSDLRLLNPQIKFLFCVIQKTFFFSLVAFKLFSKFCMFMAILGLIYVQLKSIKRGTTIPYNFSGIKTFFVIYRFL